MVGISGSWISGISIFTRGTFSVTIWPNTWESGSRLTTVAGAIKSPCTTAVSVSATIPPIATNVPSISPDAFTLPPKTTISPSTVEFSCRVTTPPNTTRFPCKVSPSSKVNVPKKTTSSSKDGENLGWAKAVPVSSKLINTIVRQTVILTLILLIINSLISQMSSHHRNPKNHHKSHHGCSTYPP